MQSLEQSTFIAFDLETTGFLPIAQRIIQVSAVKFDLQGTVYEEFDQFIDPQIPIPADASKVHKIYDEHVRGKPTIKEVLPMFKDFIGEDSILLAHNSEFDTGFLGAYYILQDEVMPENQIWDTLSISRALVKNIMNHKLETLVHHFGFDAGTFHRAIDDSIYVMKVFKKFCSLVNNSYPDMLQIAGERRFSDAKSLFSIQLPLSLMKLKKAATKKQELQFIYEEKHGEKQELQVMPEVLFKGEKYSYLYGKKAGALYPQAFRIDKISKPKVLK